MSQKTSIIKSMFILYFDIMGIVHKESMLAGQTVSSSYDCDVLQQVLENV
jgi:hypothetical protein